MAEFELTPADYLATAQQLRKAFRLFAHCEDMLRAAEDAKRQQATAQDVLAALQRQSEELLGKLAEDRAAAIRDMAALQEEMLGARARLDAHLEEERAKVETAIADLKTELEAQRKKAKAEQATRAERAGKAEADVLEQERITLDRLAAFSDEEHQAEARLTELRAETEALETRLRAVLGSKA